MSAQKGLKPLNSKAQKGRKVKKMTLQEFADKVGGKVWRKAGKVRIYFDTDKSASAYLDYDEDLGDEFELGTEGAALKVFSNCESQGREWNSNRAKQIKFEIMKRISNFNGVKICDTWQEVIL